ncbi:hypothetical protein chiPu_0014115 [Chiloscyllium punctatum]|uniref:Uncharacterized protein n=1 Tax=Chiloscyllium punctatum TaxID=137246 RepID=A0A401SZ10_CHIPU|nr:hypothetical protein [Chiloscyllium punctatum]
MWNLSLLSRGCGDLANRKHKRLDVYLEDQDYFNWKAPSKSACVSPKPHNSEDFLHHHCQPVPPKTFSTRRGALVLYSEDLALQSWQHQHSVKWRHRVRVQLSTLQDLARAILAYGQRENGAGSMQVEPYLHFLIGHRNRSGNRKIRPGYSAKQYLACLAETCDPTLLYRLQCSGYTNKLNQLQGQSVDSLLQQQTKCDLSKAPRPYRANPCLPVADLYQSWPCLDEEDKEEQGEETIFDTGESCPATDNEVKGTQSDSSRPGVREILTNRESGAEGSNPQETSLYVLVTVPARELEQITEEADQVQATQQVFNTPLTSSLNRQQPAKARDQCHSSNLPGRPIIDSSQLCCQRSRGTYYGGPLAGARRVKGRPGDQCGSRQHVEPPASVSGQLKLPSIGSETGAGLQPRQEGDSSELERWKLPQIQRRSLARGRHAGKRRKGPIPEAARFTRRLILPPIIDVRPQREKGEDIHNEATEIKGKLGSPDSIEDSRMKGLDESTWINEEYPINTEEISVQNGGSVRISENNGQMESEERMVRFITIRIEENGTPLEGKLEASESQETFKMKGLDESTQMKEDYPISTEDRSSQDGGNVGISEKVTQKENEERDLKFIRIRIEENGDLLEGHRPLECDASGRKVGLITNQEPEGEEVNGAVHRDTKHLGDVHIETGDDIVFRSDRESGHSPGSYKRSQRGRARKAFRQGGRRRTDPDGDSSGKSESRSPGGGMKVNSHRRGRVKRQPSEDPSDLQDVVLDEDGNLTSAGSHRSPVSDPFLEGEVMRGRRRAARGSGYENSAAIPSLSGWSEPEPSSLSATDELEAMCGLHTVDDGRSPSRHRRSRLLLKDDHVVAVDSGTDAEDQEAELWNQQGKGNTGIKAKKKSKRNRGQNSPNQDPNAEDSDAMPSGSEELRSSRESNYGAALNKPPGPRRSLGLNKLSEARKLTDGDQESGPKGQPGPRGSLGPNNESNRNKGRAEFVVEEEKRLQRERQKEQEEEEELLKTMNEPQRMEYLRLKQIKEEREKEEMEERRRKDGERSSILMQEAMQEAIFLLHQKGLMERDLTFSRNLWAEFLGLERDQNITRPWVFSYFELINFLGLQTPVEEGTEESSHVGQWD